MRIFRTHQFCAGCVSLLQLGALPQKEYALYTGDVHTGINPCSHLAERLGPGSPKTGRQTSGFRIADCSTFPPYELMQVLDHSVRSSSSILAPCLHSEPFEPSTKHPPCKFRGLNRPGEAKTCSQASVSAQQVEKKTLASPEHRRKPLLNWPHRNLWALLALRDARSPSAREKPEALKNTASLHGVLSRRKAQHPLWRHLHTRRL